MKILLLQVLCVLSVQGALAQTRIEQIGQLFSTYNQRFENGKYKSNSKQIKQFNLLQDNLAAQFKQNSALKKILYITNSYQQDLTVTLYALTNETNSLLGFYYEKSSYVDEEERSYLRFSTLKMAETGLNFVPVNGTHALIVKGFYITPESSMTLQFNYLENLKKNQWGTQNIFLLKKNNDWLLFTTEGKATTQAHIEVWTSIFPLNGGVKSVSF